MRPAKTFGEVLDDLEALLEPFRHKVPATATLPQDVQTTLTFIHEHLFSPDLNVQQLKRRCRIGDNNITSRFRYNLGQTIRDYIEATRMDAAAHVLAHAPEVRIYDVAHAVGYEHSQTFYRAFARHFQCTPTDYRSRFTANESKGRGTRPASPLQLHLDVSPP